MPPPQAVARLIRISLAPSALADVVAGACAGVAAGGSLRSGSLLLGCASSLCVYHAGMALNDFADRRQDVRDRPDRPIPSGALAASFALGLGSLGLALSLLCAGLAGRESLRIAAALVGLVLAYDFAAKRSRLTGPPVLGACRALNLLLGAATTSPPSYGLRLPFLAGAYAVYILLVSHLARMEDAPVPPGGARILARAAPAGLLLPSAGLPSPAGAAAAAAGAAFLLWPVLRIRDWTRGDVERTVGRFLGGTILLDASIAAGTGFYRTAGGLLFLYAAARRLAKRFPPT
ncbi:MAG TPA: UbiA family prenyltransferase [Planctomycetota bacterium]|nr:UbiA family prenyltransferase [Planctomycetota bacterium]